MTFEGTDWFEEMQRSLDSVAWAIRTTVNPTIKYSPGHLVFNQDMIFCKAVQVDWQLVHQERRCITTTTNVRENKGHINWNYNQGDQVLITMDSHEQSSQPKMNQPTRGPFTITNIHLNGTMDITCGNVTETINIRHLKPFFSG